MAFIISTQISYFSLKHFNAEFEFLNLNFTTLSALLLLAIVVYIVTQPRPVYLVNYSCYKPNDACKWSKKTCLDTCAAIGVFTDESVEFQRKVLENSGIGDDTYAPEVLKRDPLNPRLRDAVKDAQTLMFGAVDELFSKTALNPKDVGVLIVNCSLFCTVPSLSAMLVNRYKLRSNIMSYNIGGMGCSAGVISIALANDLLQLHKNTYAVVVNVENGTLSSYTGNDKSMLVSNCLFRVGSSAILLSNKMSDKRRSKYRLVHTVRTHKGADDESFNCVVQREDSEGKIGVALSKRLMVVAADALKTNMTTLGPLVLPFAEQFRFVANLVAKKLFKSVKLKTYIPDFKLAFEHFCIHSGGKAVLDGVDEKLELTDWHMEPSRMTLYRFGNTSSSSVWYELAYTEAKGRVMKGDRVWQIAFGSGFKCNSAVWKALRRVDPDCEQNPWMDEIHSFPVHIRKP